MIRYHPKAENDLWNYARYLANRVSVNLANRFLKAAEATLLELEFMPGMGGIYIKRDGIRRIRIKGFKNHILYYKQLTEDTIELVRVIHGSRHNKRFKE